MTPKLHIIGKGAFGTALSRVYRPTSFEVQHFGRDHPNHVDASYLFLAVPTRSVPEVLSNLELAKETTVVICSKGFLPDGGLASSLIAQGCRHAILSGPGFAHEISAALPTVHTIAAPADVGPGIAVALSTPTFRLYLSNDPIGVQVCGGFKNILAIAAGIADGLSLGENARAALIARGLSELSAALTAYGGQSETVLTPAGVGDLLLTCTSPSSRNYRCGQLIGKGTPYHEAVQEIGTVEGALALNGLLKILSPDQAPISTALAQIFEGQISPREAVDLLMTRPHRKLD